MLPTKARSIDRVKERVWDTLVTKVTGYGKTPITHFKWAIIVPRLDSKKERLINMSRRVGVVMGDEPMEETVEDILGYAVIWKMLDKGVYEKAPVLRAGEHEIRDVQPYEDEVLDILVEVGKVAKRKLKEMVVYNETNAELDIISYVDQVVLAFLKVDLDYKRVNIQEIMGILDVLMVECVLFLAHNKIYTGIQE